MRVLVTGSTGHIGRMQVETLRAAGHEIRTFDKFAQRKGEEGEHIPGDLRDVQIVRQAVQGVDAVAHLGAIPGDRRGADDEVLAVNVMGTLNVLVACVEAGVERVVAFSSVQALGNFAGFRPSAYLPIGDDYPRHPLSPYQISKHLGEEACKAFSDRWGLVTICMRPMYVAHPDHYLHWRGEDTNWGKSDYWAYVDIRDVCEAVRLALTVENVSSAAFLLAADDTTSETPTAELVDKHYPDTPWPQQDRAAYLADNPFRSLVDCSHAKEVLGWQPKHSWRAAK